MRLNINEVLFGFSTALDAVESELFGATSYHAQRVAYMCSLMGKKLGLSDYERICLSVAAVLHDNGLTQYIQEEMANGSDHKDIDVENNLGRHCVLGEKNVKCLPIYPDIKDAILYHHEKADATGPFGKTVEETPLFARIIHVADRADVRLKFGDIEEKDYYKVKEHIEAGIGKNYDEGVASAFLEAITYENIKTAKGNGIVASLYEEIPRIEKDYTTAEMLSISDMFARIIDFKSPFTTRHSAGIAEKAKIMGEYYKWDEETCNMLYFAGAVHDVGKLFVDNEILEKPGKLTAEEFRHIQDHATGTYVVLHGIRGLEEITDWASLHHEKLDGSGYPFKRTANELGKKERLMACIDIYQALVEPRPYKDGMFHEKAMSILREMVDDGKLDADITNDIDIVFKDWAEPKA